LFPDIRTRGQPNDPIPEDLEDEEEYDEEWEQYMDDEEGEYTEEGTGYEE
jgi:hypothetical protein